jgi:HK97 family phage major capsid protein
MNNYLQQQIDARQQAWHAAKALLDAAAAEKRDLSGEEQQSYDRMMADIDERGQKIQDLQVAEQRAADLDAALATAPEVRTERVERSKSDADILRGLVSGEIRSHTFERRDLNKASDSSIVPSAFLDSLQASLTTVGPMMDSGLVTMLNTASGEDLTIPTESTRPAATAIAEATEITALDPTFSSIVLKAQKVAVLTKVSKELLTDSGISLEAYLGQMMGTSLGIKINNLLTLGTGGGAAPNGIVTAAGSGITGGTGSTGAFTADNLIDLAHAVNGAYVRRGGAWMMRRSSVGAVRKLKDTAGNYLFVPAATVGSPDTLLGYNIYDNPDVAATGVNAKSVLFGWFGSFHVRQIGGIEIARSDDAYFAYDQIGFRATMRVWSDLAQSEAVKYFAGGTA